MESKTLKIVIIVAVIIGIIAIAGITALVVYTTKSAEPRVLDLNDATEENSEEEMLQEDENEESLLEIINQNEENEIEQGESKENNNEVSENEESPAIEAFNAKLEEYQGNNISGEKVNELLDIIRRNNEQNEEFQIKAMANVENWDNDNNKAKTDSKYIISLEKDNESGIINVIKIQDAN